MEKLIRFFKDEDGVTAIEYGLIAALIAVPIESAGIRFARRLRRGPPSMRPRQRRPRKSAAARASAGPS